MTDLRIDFESWDESATSVDEMPDTDWGLYGKLTIPPLRFFIPLQGRLPSRAELREILWKAALEHLAPLPAPNNTSFMLELTPLLQLSVADLTPPRNV